MDIELTGGQPRTRPGLLPQGSFKLLFNQSLVNGYNLKLEGKKILLPVSAAGYLLVSFGDANLQVQSNGRASRRRMKSGHYLWLNGDQPVTLSSPDKEHAGFLLLQMK
jgi:hypothetical protein